MSKTASWRGPHGVTRYWWRCDLCRWSGPPGMFIDLVKGEGRCQICLHDWCWGNDFVQLQMGLDGWQPVK